jgi:hypothetical protein
MAATARNRYGGSADSTLAQDIKALDSDDPVRDLISNLGVAESGLSVGAQDLAGRSHQSPFLMFAFLAAAHAGAADWWDGEPVSRLVDEAGKPQYSLVHPALTLRGHRSTYTSAEINELANIVFVSTDTAKNVIGTRSPADYARAVSASDLAAHAIPNNPALLEPGGYRDFLAARRMMLADRITAILDRFKPGFLAGGDEPLGTQSDRSLALTAYAGAGRSVLVADAEVGDHRWVGWIPRAELDAALDAASAGLASDVLLGDEAAPMRVDDEGSVTFAVGPFLIRGSLDQWRSVVKDAFDEVQSLDCCPEPTDEQWPANIKEFPLSSVGARV